MNIDVLNEVYSIMKEYVPTKERQAAADSLVSVIADYLDDKDLKEFTSYDNYLTRSMAEYGGNIDQDEEDDEEDYDYENYND
jgi:uncharacterized protein (DUF2267 family)